MTLEYDAAPHIHLIGACVAKVVNKALFCSLHLNVLSTNSKLKAYKEFCLTYMITQAQHWEGWKRFNVTQIIKLEKNFVTVFSDRYFLEGTFHARVIIFRVAHDGTVLCSLQFKIWDLFFLYPAIIFPVYCIPFEAQLWRDYRVALLPLLNKVSFCTRVVQFSKAD